MEDPTRARDPAKGVNEEGGEGGKSKQIRLAIERRIKKREQNDKQTEEIVGYADLMAKMLIGTEHWGPYLTERTLWCICESTNIDVALHLMSHPDFKKVGASYGLPAIRVCEFIRILRTKALTQDAKKVEKRAEELNII